MERPKKSYIYKNSKFERLQGALPPLLKDWTSFDWSVDYDDQINVISTLPEELRARQTPDRDWHALCWQ